MTEEFGRFEDGPEGRRRSGAGLGALVLVAALGVGIGLLAAPETGVKTRRRLRRRLATLGSEVGDGLEGVQELGGRARERMRARLAAMRRRERDLDEDLEDEEDEDEADESRSTFGTLAALAAGAAASYFLSSERAAPARTRVRETAETVRRRAGDRWQQFQQSRGDGHSRRAGDAPETPGQVGASDEPPLGS